jgi:hypothetical protein
MYDTEMELPVIDSLDDLVDAVALLGRLNARVAMAAAELEPAGAWGVDGHVSMASWLRDRCRLGHNEATAMLRLGRFLVRYDAIGHGVMVGRLTMSQVRLMQGMVTRPTADLFDVMHDEFVDTIADLTVADTAVACQAWQRGAEAIADMPQPAVPDRSLRYSRLDDGTMVGRFTFDATLAALFAKAIDTARSWDGTDDQRSRPVANADALADVIAFFNANHDAPGTPRHRPHLELHQRAGDDHAHATGTSGSHVLDEASTATLTCDCVIHRIIRNGSAVLDYGRATRTVPPHLFRATAARDGCCRFPGCERPVAWCDAHHIRWWRSHGETKLDNLLLLCNRHHHLVHRESWAIELQADAECRFTGPSGTTLSSRPRGQPTIRAA